MYRRQYDNDEEMKEENEKRRANTQAVVVYVVSTKRAVVFREIRQTATVKSPLVLLVNDQSFWKKKKRKLLKTTMQVRTHVEGGRHYETFESHGRWNVGSKNNTRIVKIIY